MSSEDRSLGFAPIFWGTLGLFMFVNGIQNNDIVSTSLGLSLIFTCILLAASRYVTNIKLSKILEYSSIIGSLGIILHGYIITENMFLLFIALTIIIVIICRIVYLKMIKKIGG
ncbi:MAG: hypothetical protein QW743_05230 [Candidatus Methanomethylicia archaeon]